MAFMPVVMNFSADRIIMKVDYDSSQNGQPEQYSAFFVETQGLFSTETHAMLSTQALATDN